MSIGRTGSGGGSTPLSQQIQNPQTSKEPVVIGQIAVARVPSSDRVEVGATDGVQAPRPSNLDRRGVAAVEAALRSQGIDPNKAVANVSGYLARAPDDFRTRRDGPPTIQWHPSFFQKAGPLCGVGTLTEFKTRNEAFDAIALRRAGGAQGHVFLVTIGTSVDGKSSGWMLAEYTESRLGKVDLTELSVAGLPLGGRPNQSSAETYVVDGRGHLGQLRMNGQDWRLEELARQGSQLVPKSRGAPAFRLELHGQKLDEPAPVADSLPWVVPSTKTNHGKNVQFTPSIAFRPGPSIDELGKTLAWIDANLPKHVKVKAGGSLHSWSPVAATNGVFIHPEGIRFISSLTGAEADRFGARKLDPKSAENLFRIGSGTQIREINRRLWDEFGKALPVLGGFDGQTIGGVLPTGTHGSVLSSGPLASMIRSIDLVRSDGQKVRIEPSAGPTDPDAFRATHSGWELVQDNSSFSASLVNMGTLGVVHSYVVEAKDKFFLNEVRTETTFAKSIQTLEGGNIYNLTETSDRAAKPTSRRFEGHPERAFHLELLFNPHGERVVVTSRQPTKLTGEEPPAEKPGRDLFRALGTPDRFDRPDLPTWITENFHDFVGNIGTTLGKLIPKLTPGIVDRALASMSDAGYFGRSYNVFNIGDGANQIPSLSGTLFVPLEGDKYLRAMEIIQRTAAELVENTGEYHNGPISLRFVKGSDAHLASQEDVASFELIFAGNPPHAETHMKAYYEALRKELGPESVRVHFGQLLQKLEPASVFDGLPKADAWKKFRNELDPNARFVNEWQARALSA
ncbi:MAG: FAD-binding protein [Deltaproteobacteria bacterium]|nr:FAD-binding protein [Deltaproteobacteria bacterium]